MPKKTRAQRVGDFQPINLINGIQKIISKVLACQLKERINALIEPSQSAFLRGCSILDGVLIAQKIISTCSKYIWSAFFLKLDFAKTFDMIDWSFLLKVLQARGFGVRWCGWTQALFSLGFSSVLVNGQPGAPFRYRHGL